MGNRGFILGFGIEVAFWKWIITLKFTPLATMRPWWIWYWSFFYKDIKLSFLRLTVENVID